ncbi:MAG: alpha-glucan family phosphorylase, partial [Planctomycetota bacterium]
MTKYPHGLKPTTRLLPDLPEALAPLREVACNLWWTWDAHARSVFESIDARRWQGCEHNPVALLRRVPRQRLQQLAADRSFLAQMRRVRRRMGSYIRQRTWFQERYAGQVRGLVAYFSMEFGLHESLPIFAGGLGVLAGDHFKSASDLGLPLIGLGIFWRRGYVRQRIDTTGRQAERYDRLSPADLPLTEVRDRANRPLRIRIPVGRATVLARAWRLNVGRVGILLLDTHLPANAPRHRRLTDGLYLGDRDTRIRQEIVLGIGGWKLLRALKLPVAVCHLNEGHAAFRSVDRVAEVMQSCRCDAEQAARQVAAATVFTTHTPVPEGNETFAPELVAGYFDRYCRRNGIDADTLISWARVDPADADEEFGLTPLALRLSTRRNGVSRLHGQVSRKMWHGIWPKRSLRRVPIGSITNGVHLQTWMHPRMVELLDDYLPGGWLERQDQPRVWRAVEKIPDARLWALHLALKAELLDFVRIRLQSGRSGRQTRRPGVLEPDALTIGFARRFAPYKRATLIFSDPRRLERLVNHRKRPVQLIFAGKAHPADAGGKALVAQVVRHARSQRFKGRVVFLEDYDMEVARRLVAGVDVWLNNPRRPQEASGTSGMKPALHGGLNLSILDGWWPEACVDGVNGWAVGTGEDHDASPATDRREARALYQRLER